METSYPSQLALSTASSSDPTSTSNSGTSCLSPGTSSSPTAVDASRHAVRTCDATDRDENDCSTVDASQNNERAGEQGSSARPRTLLRRSRTTQQTRDGARDSSRLRRASESAYHDHEWTQATSARSAQGSFRSQEERGNAGWECLERQTCQAASSIGRTGRPTDTDSARHNRPSCPSVSAPTSASSEPTLAESALLCRSASLPSLSAFPPAQPTTARTTQDANATSPFPRHRRSRSLPTVSFSSRSASSPPFRTFEPSHSDSSSRPPRSKHERDVVRPTEQASSRFASSANNRKVSASRSLFGEVLTQADLVKAHAASLARSGIEVSARLVSACLIPPITRHTLRELDLQEVMRNAQLRHDVVFDPNLMFRPNFDGERGERKRLAAEQYWVAVSREISQGCRCSTFADSSLLPCICAGSTMASTSADGVTSSISPSRLSGRIVPLVAELRGILLSLLPATLPTSATAFSTAINGTPSHAPESAPESLAYGPREQLIDALDPVKISQQLVQGVLDVAGLARFLGATLKTHCAPMRDALVDDMVSTSEGPDGIVTALRMCFEILELMKLDIANHQLRSLRPYLLQTSVEFERRFFDGVNGRTAIPRSRNWLETTLENFGKDAQDVTQDPSRLLDRIVAHGVLDLVFSPPFSPSSSTITTPAPPMARRPSFSSFPETLQLDAFRFAHFHSDVTDLTIVYMLALLYQQLSFPARPSPADVDVLRHELWCIMSSNTGSPSSLVDSPASVVGIPSGPAGPGITKLEDPSWREAMQDAILQVAARAQHAKLGAAGESDSTLPAPDPQLVSFVQGYFDANARSDSKVFQLLSRRLREVLGLYVRDELAKEKERGDYEFLTWWTAPVGDVTMRTGHRRVANAGGRGFPGGSFAPSSDMMASMSPAALYRGSKRSHAETPDDDDNDNDDELDVVEKRQRVGRSGSIPIRHRDGSAASRARFDASLTRNGLACLASEVKVLGNRIAKVTSFNLSVFRPIYESVLSEHCN